MFENALKYCPHDQKILRLFARFLEKIGNLEKAEKLLSQAEIIEPQTQEISL